MKTASYYKTWSCAILWKTLKSVSRDQTWKWIVRRKGGESIKAVDLQRMYLKAAQERYTGRDEQTDYVLGEWESCLDALERDPYLLADKLDWVAKRKMMEDYIESEDGAVQWGDDILHSLDLEYHNVNPETGLYYGLEQAGMIQAGNYGPAHLRGNHDAAGQHAGEGPGHCH